MMDKSLARQVEEVVIRERLLERGDSIVAAVSGGPDSLALLHILFVLSVKWRWRIVVAHVDHQFRGEESANEALYVKRLSESWGLTCELASIDLPHYIAETGMNAQEAAREKRYDFLTSVAHKYEANRIALAHHMDDQAETMLMRVLRGTSISGLAGIPMRRNIGGTELVRPLLHVRKAEIVHYCHQQGLQYVQDSSNQERHYLRNHVRLDIMPQLLEINPRLPEALHRLALTARSEDAYIEATAEEAYRRIVQQTAQGIAFKRDEWLTLHVALQRRLIKLILNYLDCSQETMDFDRAELLRQAIAGEQPSTITLDIDDSIRFVREYDVIRFSDKKAVVEVQPFCYELQGEAGEVEVTEANLLLKYWVSEQCPEPAWGMDHNVFDWETIVPPVYIRSRIAGDRMWPMGLNGSKKVKDMFIDAKIPPSFRDRVPIIASQDRILWIPGVRRSSHAMISERTRRYLIMQLIRYD